jgi:predicted amidophosphoribosyltransferase
VRNSGRRVVFVNPTSIALGMLLVLLTVLLLYKMRKLKPQIAGYGTQTMCPFCGLITSRLKASCMECGKPLARVEHSTRRK